MRKNLEKIVELRNISTHFITEEYELIYIPLFQSCVINYTNKLMAYFNVDITERLGSNFLTLSVRLSDIDENEIKARYPSTIVSKLLHTKDDIENSLPDNGQDKYAIKVTHDWALVKNPKHATATFSISASADEATYIMKQTIDPQSSYPFKTKKCIDLINKWIRGEGIPFVSPARPEEQPGRFNTNHFDLFCKFYNIKENDVYTYCYNLNSNPSYSYNQKLIEFMKNEIRKDPEHIIQSLRAKIKK